MTLEESDADDQDKATPPDEWAIDHDESEPTAQGEESLIDHDEPAEGDLESAPVPDPPSPPATFERQPLSTAVRWVWFVGYLVPSTVVTLIVLQVDLFVLPTRTGLVTALVLVGLLAVSVWRTTTRYRAWSWELDETELIIDRGVVFKLTRIVPRIRVQHVDLSSGPVDRFFNLRQVAIYTAGTREADAAIPGLTSESAEALRQALIARPPTSP